METITVKAVLPAYAYLDIRQAPDGEAVYSRHRLTWRGLRNAIRHARDIAHEYERTHGNMAAFRVRIEACGLRASPRWWRELLGCAFDGEPLSRATVERFRAIDEQTAREEEEAIARDDAERFRLVAVN